MDPWWDPVGGLYGKKKLTADRFFQVGGETEGVSSPPAKKWLTFQRFGEQFQYYPDDVSRCCCNYQVKTDLIGVYVFFFDLCRLFSLAVVSWEVAIFERIGSSSNHHLSGVLTLPCMRIMWHYPMAPPRKKTFFSGECLACRTLSHISPRKKNVIKVSLAALIKQWLPMEDLE